MRARAALVVASLLAALGLVGGCGGKPSPRPVAQRFLDAVAHGDFASAGALAGVDAATIRTSYHDFLSALSAPHIGFELRSVGVADSGGTADATFTATVAPGGYGVYSYDAHLALRMTGGGWHPVWSTTVVHPALTPGQRIVLTRRFGPRAPIIGGDGRVLVGAGPVVTVGVHPAALHDRGSELDTLARVVGVDVAGLRRAVAAAHPDDFVPVITLRRSAFEQLKPRLDPLPGVPYRPGTAQLAPTATFARALLGRVGEATHDALSALGAPYRPGDQVGLYGLEAAFERRLAGTPTASVVVEDAKGSELRTLTTFRGKAGQPVRVTIDRRVQAAAEAALGPADSSTGRQVSLVAVRVGTGELLAVANRPGQSSFDAALVGRYPPGSTFKVVTTTALLSGGLRLDEPVPCPPSVDIGGKVFTNFQGESAPGSVPFLEDFAMSCNTAFVGLSRRLDGRALREAAAAYGIGSTWQLAVPAFTGSVPAASDQVERAADAIGQGRVLVSPLDMAMVAATVASGSWHAPSLVTDPAPGAQPSVKDLPAGVATSLRTLMRAVVTRGTARGALAQLPGEPIYGKTGTAEYGSGNPPRTHAWFIGYRGDVAFAVVVPGGGVGGEVAAPIAARFLRALGGS